MILANAGGKSHLRTRLEVSNPLRLLVEAPVFFQRMQDWTPNLSQVTEGSILTANWLGTASLCYLYFGPWPATLPYCQWPWFDIVSDTDLFILIPKLKQGILYCVLVSASNEIGTSPAIMLCPPVEIPIPRPPSPPSAVRLDSKDGSTLALAIEHFGPKLQRQQQNFRSVKYLVWCFWGNLYQTRHRYESWVVCCDSILLHSNAQRKYILQKEWMDVLN